MTEGRKGAVVPAEWFDSPDAVTGTSILQITSHPTIQHPSYFLQSSFLPGDRELFFVSYRTAAPQLWLASLQDGSLKQLTDGVPIHPFSPAFREQTNEIVFTRGGSLWAIQLDTLEERLVIEVPRAQFGECSLSPDGEWATAAFKSGFFQGLVVGKLDGTGWIQIPFDRTCIHPQFHPLEPEWIEFAGDPAPRMHRVRRDGTALECLYQHGNDEFVVHETFLGKTGDLVFTIWPQRLCRMDWTTRAITSIAEHNAWHIAPNSSGTQVLFDTNYPDRGIQIIDVSTLEIKDVCQSSASNGGSQWKESRYALAEDFERAISGANSGGTLSWMEAKVDTVYGPQWTHPHPSWSRDESRIAFASDRTGTTQVYVARIPNR
ncbi:MAG: PD40 domain-containing protein [Bryobacteraceae bacterium]|nr:PD40 domain-containing protein [Bryobacteraceae bacterium]